MTRLARLLPAAFLIAAPRIAQACPACFGDPEAPATKGMTAAILFLLGLTACVLGGFTAMALVLRRQSRKRAAAEASGDRAAA